jgi:hypothetical protein
LDASLNDHARQILAAMAEYGHEETDQSLRLLLTAVIDDSASKERTSVAFTGTSGLPSKTSGTSQDQH